VGGKAANELGLFDMSGNVYEWTFDNWNASFNSAAVTNPLVAHQHTQKVRRGGSGNQPTSEARVSARKIRSIDGKDGEIGFRLALSSADSYPNNMANPCDIHQPPPTGGKFGLRDERLITEDGEVWHNEMMNFVLVVKANGAARMAMLYNGSPMPPQIEIGASAQGEWYTTNSFSLNIISSSGTKTKYAYYIVDNNTMSLISEASMPVGRFLRKSASAAGVSSFPIDVANPREDTTLARIYGNGTANMSNPPTTGRDGRLIQWSSKTWLQDNVALNAGGTHRYRTDFFSNDSMRFVVYDVGAMPSPTSITLSEYKWFTVDNTFLRVTGCPAPSYPARKPELECGNFDYLYTVSADSNNFYHISFQEYENGDFRMFERVSTGNVPGWLEPQGFYYQGYSTYIPPSEGGVGSPSSSSKTVSSSSGGNQPSSSSGGNRSSSSSANTTPINAPKAVSGPLFAYATGKTIVLENVPSGAKIEIYNLRGEQVHSGRAYGIRPDMGFMVQTKGVYFVKVNSRTLRVLVM
jgi:hypothetical protein